MLPFLTPGIVPSPTGAGGAVPAAADGVVVGGGTGPVASGIGASAPIDDLSLEAAGRFAGPGALAAGEDWLVEVGADDGAWVGPEEDWATPQTEVKSKADAAASIVFPVPFIDISRISTSTRGTEL